ncbi:peptide/nickel transport system permease protein [Streptosporangium subroseum]|uniref:Peptide/nickel transport system permease protein n=1 Tax=Streptosporangium subroseum TaxID=106412 RepID=A0A239NW98_9ACTN|nr:ABC transporter permease [Streptosporangium subroseum]SNT58708.1 peptide/nickel transport system permease protein [Streptosporangium subroseum]
MTTPVTAPVTAPATVPAAPPPGPPRPRRRVPRAGLVLAVAFFALVCAAAAFPGLFAGPPNLVDPVVALRGPGGGHPFGTDQLGRDVFARVVHGARASLLVGLGSTLLAGVAGSAWGLLAALGGRAVREAAMRLADIFLSFPSVLMALLVIAVLGPGTGNAVVAITISLAPGFARVVRVRALVVRDSPYVRAAVNLGLRPGRILRRHIVPNVLAPLLILATLNVGTAVIAGASLSFLGLGPQPPDPEWGSMLAQSRNYLDAGWTLAIFPGGAITLTVMSVTIIGRELQARYEGRESR